ncbi:MAG: EamA family transporter [Ruminiclostridium sp.]
MISIIFALLSALFAAMTTILCKCGLKDADSDAATALRTTIVLVLSAIVVWVTGEWTQLPNATGMTLLFLILSGCATGASWLCYFKALKMADVNEVAPIDKSSVVLTMLMSFIFLGEQLTPLKIAAMVLIGAGTLMMSIRKGNGKKKAGRWMIFAWLSAIFAALTSILAKIGVENVNSNLATAIRTAVVLVMAWVVVAAKGKKNVFSGLGGKAFVFIALSAVATAASWLCFYYALKNGDASVVVPIDKLSILAVVLFSRIFLKEKLTAMSAAGLVLLTAGTVLTAIPI